MAAPLLRYVRQILRERLLSDPDISSLPLAVENVNFTPPEPSLAPDASQYDGCWLREQFQPNTESHAASKLILGEGRMQYDVVCAQGWGTDELDELAQQVAELFAPGTVLRNDFVNVHLTRVERSGGFEPDDTWYTIPVSIRWFLLSRLD